MDLLKERLLKLADAWVQNQDLFAVPVVAEEV